MNNEDKVYIVDSLGTLEDDKKEVLLACGGGIDIKPSHDLIEYIEELEEVERDSENKRQAIAADVLMSSIYGWYGNELLDGAVRSAIRDSKRNKNKLPVKRIESIGDNSLICRGICPKCNSKLIRGKKDKKNGYKRTWRCESCNMDFIIES